MIKMKCNCCDGIYNTFDVHFTKYCDNNCKHCVDKLGLGIDTKKPNVDNICESIIANKDKINDVLFLGGEPLLFLDEMLECCKRLKKETDLELYVTTSMPKVCYDNKEKLFELIENLNCLNISVQHYDEVIADKVRCSKSKYDRQSFYKEIIQKFPDKIRICGNIVKGMLDTRADIVKFLKQYESYGVKCIKLSEIQNFTQYYTSFEKLFDLKLPSAYSHGCQKYVDVKLLGPEFKDSNFKFLLRRCCFITNKDLKATFGDTLKMFLTLFRDPFERNNSRILYEDGSIHTNWV